MFVCVVVQGKGGRCEPYVFWEAGRSSTHASNNPYHQPNRGAHACTDAATDLLLGEDHGVLGLQLPGVAGVRLVDVRGMVAAGRHRVHGDLVLVAHDLEELLAVVDVSGQHDAGADDRDGLIGRGRHLLCGWVWGCGVGWGGCQWAVKGTWTKAKGKEGACPTHSGGGPRRENPTLRPQPAAIDRSTPPQIRRSIDGGRSPWVDRARPHSMPGPPNHGADCATHLSSLLDASIKRRVGRPPSKTNDEPKAQRL